MAALSQDETGGVLVITAVASASLILLCGVVIKLWWMAFEFCLLQALSRWIAIAAVAAFTTSTAPTIEGRLSEAQNRANEIIDRNMVVLPLGKFAGADFTPPTASLTLGAWDFVNAPQNCSGGLCFENYPGSSGSAPNAIRVTLQGTISSFSVFGSLFSNETFEKSTIASAVAASEPSVGVVIVSD